MKKLNILFAILGVVIFASCSNEIEVPDNPLANPNQVIFSSTIGDMGTRATGTSWDAGDAIGVYALNAGQALSESAVYDGKANIKYNTPGDGKFTAAAEGITFPSSGNLDFVAYYPYKANINNYTYDVNVSNQTKPADIDLLYSANAVGANKANPLVNLNFKHKLSLLILNISTGDGVANLNGLTSKIENMKVNASMNLADGVVTAGATVGTINPVLNNSGNTAIATAIVVPQQNLNTVKVLFTLNGKVYEWIPESQALESGKKYSYNLKLSTSGVITVSPSATIEDWQEGYTGTGDIVLTPDEGETPDPGEMGDLLFVGADFEDWTAFTGGLSTHGLKDYATQSVGGGMSGSKALHINGTPGGNDFVFTALVPEGFDKSKAEYIEFYIKGVGAKSLSLNVYKAGTGFQAYNLGDCSADKDVDLAANNQYDGIIDTGNKWVKIRLNVSSLDIQTAVGQNLFALKVGKEVAYDLLVDNFTIVEGDGTVDPEPEPEPEPEPTNLLFPGSNFDDWSAFTGNLNSYGLKAGYTSQSDNGRDGSKALYLKGTPSGNDYVFTGLVPEGFSTAGKSKIVFYIKGTSAKSLSLNVYVGKGTTMGTDYKCYNLTAYSAPSVLEPTASNGYTGAIDTGGDWMKVTLDISSLTVNSNKGDNLFALKVGKDAVYDLLVDDITLE